MQNMMRDIPLFVEVAKQKSFTLAAETLNLPISTLSRRISKMEKHLGVKLLHRNSRNVELTSSGSIFFERCNYILADVTSAYESLTQQISNPSGLVRIALPGDVYHCYLSRALCSFATTWPDIHLSITFSERWIDLLTEPFDLDLRIGPQPDSLLKARKLATLNVFLYASPALLKQHSTPIKPQDLTHLPCITLRPWGDTWDLSNGKQHVSVDLQPVHTFNSLSSSLDFAVHGLGVTCLTQPIAAPFLQRGELVPVLPDWQYRKTDLYVVMASGQLPTRVRLLVEHLAAHMAKLTT